MCTICAAFQPFSDECPYTDADAPSYDDAAVAAASSLPTYTTDQVAQQLTDDFWSSWGGGRAFDISVGDTLNVDITALATNGQAMAREALAIWSEVSGILFNEVSGDAPASAVVTETTDAASDNTTTYSMSVGEDFAGTMDTGADRDAVAITLAAGETIDIELYGDDTSGNGTSDPYLRIYDASNTLLAQNDDANGRDSALTFQATTAGTYYLQAGSYADANAGDYILEVREAGEAAHLTFDDEESGAYASSSTFGGTILSSFINVNKNWAGGDDRIDGYHFQTYIHEIGHALGLGHAGNYNGSADYGSDAHYANDSWQMTVMSYFHQTENPAIAADFAYVITPMLADILAIHNLYGTPDAQTGDTVYGNNSTAGGYLETALDLQNNVAFTVFDTGGADTFDFSQESAHQRMDLREETYSDLAGIDGNVGIARGTIIEHGKTGTGNDTITGNDADNGLSAGWGTDRIDGGLGFDALSGGSGNDDLNGGDDADMIEGGSGDNTMDGGGGADLVIGGDVTLDMLMMVFPDWAPPSNAQTLLDNDSLHELWMDIVVDQGLDA